VRAGFDGAHHTLPSLAHQTESKRLQTTMMSHDGDGDDDDDESMTITMSMTIPVMFGHTDREGARVMGVEWEFRVGVQLRKCPKPRCDAFLPRGFGSGSSGPAPGRDASRRVAKCLARAKAAELACEPAPRTGGDCLTGVGRLSRRVWWPLCSRGASA